MANCLSFLFSLYYPCVSFSNLLMMKANDLKSVKETHISVFTSSTQPTIEPSFILSQHFYRFPPRNHFEFLLVGHAFLVHLLLPFFSFIFLSLCSINLYLNTKTFSPLNLKSSLEGIWWRVALSLTYYYIVGRQRGKKTIIIITLGRQRKNYYYYTLGRQRGNSHG